MAIEPNQGLLHPAQGIAEFMGETLPRTHYLLETGALPGFKFGGQWSARRSTLNRFLEEREALSLERARAAGGST